MKWKSNPLIDILWPGIPKNFSVALRGVATCQSRYSAEYGIEAAVVVYDVFRIVVSEVIVNSNCTFIFIQAREIAVGQFAVQVGRG